MGETTTQQTAGCRVLQHAPWANAGTGQEVTHFPVFTKTTRHSLSNPHLHKVSVSPPVLHCKRGAYADVMHYDRCCCYFTMNTQKRSHFNLNVADTEEAGYITKAFWAPQQLGGAKGSSDPSQKVKHTFSPAGSIHVILDRSCLAPILSRPWLAGKGLTLLVSSSWICHAD